MFHVAWQLAGKQPREWLEDEEAEGRGQVLDGLVRFRARCGAGFRGVMAVVLAGSLFWIAL